MWHVKDGRPITRKETICSNLGIDLLGGYHLRRAGLPQLRRRPGRQWETSPVWGDGQRPPHLAGALDAIAPTQAAQLQAWPQPSQALGLLWTLPAVQGPQGALGGNAFQGPAWRHADGPGTLVTT